MKGIGSRIELFLGLLIVLLAVIFTIANPRFASFANFFDLIKSYSFFGILAVGAFVVLLSGGIDISFTATAQVAQYVTVAWIVQHGGNLWLALAIGLVIGTLLGAFNGVLIHFVRIPPIITTIGTLNLYFGVLYVLSAGNIIFEVAPFYRQLSEATLPGGFPVLGLLWLGVVLLTGWMLHYTVLGRSIYALGGSETASVRVGFSVLKTRLFVYTFMGLLAGFASVVHTSLVQSAIPNSIVGKELDVLAAVVLGGASIKGGSGSLLGTCLGVIFLAVIGNGLTMMGISSYWNGVTVGLALLVGITVSKYQQEILAIWKRRPIRTS